MLLLFCSTEREREREGGRGEGGRECVSLFLVWNIVAVDARNKYKPRVYICGVTVNVRVCVCVCDIKRL